MSTPSPGGSPPLDRFLERWWSDRDAGRVLGLEEYLALFPGDSENIAREYLALKGIWKDTEGASAANQRIGHYRLVRELGGGGQGVVYLARDQRLQRDVAIKKMRRGRMTLDHLERFRREARIASQLDHPGICPVYDIGDDGGDPFIVMRYVEGATLASRIDDLRSSNATAFRFVELAPVDGEEDEDDGAATSDTEEESAPRPRVPSRRDLHAVLRLIEQIARALHEAHEAGVVHRDVKPANVVVTPDGQPVLLDFGLATMTGGELTSVTESGQTPGTPAYMSPEQMAGRGIKLDRRSDVYSLGVTLFECLTLTRPFDRTSQIARQVLFVDAPDPQKLNPAVSDDLKTVIAVALEKDRERRYLTAADFADDLRCVREHKPIKARPVGPIGKLIRFARRNPVVAASLFTVVAVLAGALIVTSAQRNDLRRALSLSKPLADAQEVALLAPWSDRLWPTRGALIGGSDGIDAWLAKAGALLARKPEHERALGALHAGEGDYDADARSVRIRATESLIAALAPLDEQVISMRKRRDAAESLERRTMIEPHSEWERVAAAVASDPRFAGIVPLRPQEGLIPLGRSLQGYEEFVVAESGATPGRKANGALAMTPASAIVLVLLPGGTLRFHTRPEGAKDGIDPRFVETPVPAFFIGKHEVTQGQWERSTGSNPAHARKGSVSVPITPLHPVEFVSWVQAAEFCRRLDLDLPTQDQWELAARASDEGRWGDCDVHTCLEGRENLADLEYARINPQAPHENWDDGFRFTAPIDALAPSSFGLHHMLGNVEEWCREHYSLVRIPSVDAIAQPPLGLGNVPERRHVVRGASWQGTRFQAGCSWFGANLPLGVQPTLGLRVVRDVRK